jgi:hypothetical protein
MFSGAKAVLNEIVPVISRAVDVASSRPLRKGFD